MNKHLIRAATGLLATPLVIALSALPAQAGGSPHFINHATDASLSGWSLNVSFKEAGLSSGSVETVVTSASVATTYECVNGGGKNPSASNKHTYDTSTSTSGTFTADQNGNITGTETLSPPSAADLGFSCPGGQTTTFVSVTYSNVTVTDTTSGATTGLGGSYTYTNTAAPMIR